MCHQMPIPFLILKITYPAMKGSRMVIIKWVGSIVQLAGVLKDASDDFRKVAAGKSKNEKWSYYRVSSLVSSLVSTCRSISEQLDSLHAIGGYFPC